MLIEQPTCPCARFPPTHYVVLSPYAPLLYFKGFSASALPAARSASSASFAGASPKFNSAVKPKQADTAKQAEERQYPWLKDLRDANKNPIGHPDYDPSTLYVPPNPKRWVTKDGRFVEKDLSDFEKQYWAIKKTLFDTILFFKKGKFYEMYVTCPTIPVALRVSMPSSTLCHLSTAALHSLS